MSTHRSRFAVPLALLLIVSSFSAAALIEQGPVTEDLAVETGAADDGHSAETVTVNGAGDVPIEVTIFKPASASTSDPVPVILHGHGWGGEGWDNTSQAKDFLDEGYGVASIDQRGHGDSGGQARVMSPDHEAEDVKAVIDRLAQRDWVETEAGNNNDPVLGAMGGSYGGGYQLVTALDRVHETGDTRFDALAPGITWYDLARSLAPNRVVKSEWADALVAIAKAPPVTDTHPDLVDKPYAYTVATGDLPGDDTPGLQNITAEYRAHSPAGFVEDVGVQLDVPTLFQQGMSDTLFPLDQAVANYQQTLTASAQSDSYVVGHTTGHVLPSFGPPQGRLQAPAGGSAPCADEIAGSQTDLLLAWFDTHLKGQDRSADLPDAPITVPTEDGDCVEVQDLPPADWTASAEDRVVTVSGPAGPPNLVPVAEGDARIVGSPSVDATVTSASADTRFFVGLAVGESPEDATVVHSQWRPVRLEGPVEAQPVSVDLPDTAVDVEDDETVYLATATSLDMYAHHGSRTPGPVSLEDVSVDLPRVQAGS